MGNSLAADEVTVSPASSSPNSWPPTKFGILWAIDTVANGIEAINAAKTLHYDVVLMDVQMPEMDGVAATKAIRAFGGQKGNIPVIAITANAMAGDREEYLEAGMNDYLPKPFKPNDLLKAIDRWMNETPPTGELPIRGIA